MSEKEILKYLDSIKFYNYTTCLDPVDTDLGKLQRKEGRALKIARSCVIENKKLQQENQQLKDQLKQRDEVINKSINKLGRYVDEMVDNGNAYAICVDLLDTLQRYRGNNK